MTSLALRSRTSCGGERHRLSSSAFMATAAWARLFWRVIVVVFDPLSSRLGTLLAHGWRGEW
jgi:hypothetical protein